MSSSTNRPLPSDTLTTFVKDEVTVVLSTSDKPHVIDQHLNFSTNYYLIYSENVEIKGSIKLPGRNIGIFCTDISIADNAVIDVSGKNGAAGINSATGDAGAGGGGANAGDVWVFVQNGVEDTLKKLRIKSFGGDGGRGGDSSANKGRGGNGGKGGNGGNINVWYGWTTRSLGIGLRNLSKKPWTQQALNLLNGTSLPDIPKRLSSEQKSIVQQYTQLQAALQQVLIRLQGLDQKNAIISRATSSVVALLGSPKSPNSTDGFSHAVRSLQRASSDIDSLARGQSKALEDAVQSVTTVIQGLPTQEDSGLTTVVDDVSGELSGLVHDLEREVKDGCRFIEAGEGGPTGSGAIGSQAASPGKKGTIGTHNAVNMRLNASTADLVMNQVYAFPEQCQMLLNKADSLFFTNTASSRERASILYTRLVDRLSFLAVDPENFDASKLAEAYTQMESTWELTVGAMVLLKSVYEQANSRLNRMLLGQDMWGHGDNWVPRLSIQFYDEYLKSQLNLLESEEKLIGEYEAKWQNNNDTTTEVNKGIDSMQSQRQAAEDKIKLLTADNGPLVMSVYKITAFTPQLKIKRTELSEALRNVELESKFDPQLLINALSTIVGLKPEFASLTKLASLGYDTYKATTTAKNMQGQPVKKEYIIDQLSTCSDDLGSLETVFSTRKDQTIEVDEPGCVKILAAVDSIKNIVKQFKNILPQAWRDKLSKGLDEYVKLIQTRNDAVMEYNTSIQLLAESLNERDYCEEQVAKLGQVGTKLDQDLPAIIYWLRKTRDALRLIIMQNLNYQARAIRFWGLRDKITMLGSQPLQGAVFLREQHEKLHEAFGATLEQYATNVRNEWPMRDNQQALFKRLTPAEITALKNSRIMTPRGAEYDLLINVDTQLDRKTFGDRIDIRLSQVRLWLLGVDLAGDETGRKLLSVQLIHSGEDDIQDEHMKEHKFSHDPVTIGFDYDASKVDSLENAVSKYVFSCQQIQDDHYIGDTSLKSSIAALGPFTTWRVRVRESANEGLDLQGLREAYLEFRGTSRVNQSRRNGPGMDDDEERWWKWLRCPPWCCLM